MRELKALKDRSALQGARAGERPISIGYRTENGVVMPTVLPTLGRRGPGPGVFVGALRPTKVNTVGTTTAF